MASKPLKIAMIAACPFPAQHGTPSSVIDICAKLQAAGLDVHVVTYYTRDYDADFPFAIHRIAPYGVAKQKMGVGPSLRRILYDFLLVFKVISVIRRERIDLIHSHNYEGGLAGWLASLVTRRPHVYQAHNTMIDELPQYESLKPKVLVRALARLLDFWVPRTAHHVIAITSQLKEFLVVKGLPAARVTHIPLAMSMQVFDQPSASDALQKFSLPEGPKVMYTGTLDVFQRLDLMVEAFAQAQKVVEKASLVMVANRYKETQLEALRQKCADNGVLDRLTVITDSTLEELPALLRQADVAVVSRPDCPGFPMKILNYMAAGAPIACFANSASLLEDGKTALLAKDHDVADLAGKMLRLLQDATLAKSLGVAARAAFEQSQQDQSAPKFIEVYRGLCPLESD
ncbi:MAG: glycosyltransferase family 4 protein [Desulfuromonadales bacterium]|nr:glycosyltransferase family 4 protein [Desulfuromonadales bacterium]